MNSIIVLDTNLLISAALFTNSVSRSALDKARFNYILATSIPCFDELKDVIFRPKFKKYINTDEAISFLEFYKNNAHFFEITHSVTDCRDPKDNKFLDLALSASANLIVSGDGDLLDLSPYRSIPILTPAQFLEI
jgi:uncharacterized protein